ETKGDGPPHAPGRVRGGQPGLPQQLQEGHPPRSRARVHPPRQGARHHHPRHVRHGPAGRDARDHRGHHQVRARDRSAHDPGLAGGAVSRHRALPRGAGARLAGNRVAGGRRRRADQRARLPAPRPHRDLRLARAVLPPLLLPPAQDLRHRRRDAPRPRGAAAPPRRGRGLSALPGAPAPRTSLRETVVSSSRPIVAIAALIALLAGACAAPRPAPPRPAALAASLRGHHHSVTSLVLSPDGGRLISGSRDGRLRLWNTATDTPEATLSPNWWPSSMWTVAVSPDGALVAGGADDFLVHIWDVKTRKLRVVLEGHTQSIRVLGWSSDGRLFASGGRDTTVRLWDTATWKEIARLPHLNTVRGLAWAPDGARLFSGTADDVIYAWEVRSGTLLATLRGHRNTVHALAITP